MPITKQQVAENLEEIKQNIQIKNRYNSEVIYESKKDTIKEVVEEAVQKEINLSEADLSGIDLSKSKLTEADLSKALLREVDLYGSDLSKSKLTKADLSKALLREANLFESDLREANLFESDLREANLYGANLHETEMENAKFFGKRNNPYILKENQIDDFLAALGFRRIKKEDFTNNKN